MAEFLRCAGRLPGVLILATLTSGAGPRDAAASSSLDAMAGYVQQPVVRFVALPAAQAGYVGAFPEIYIEGPIADTTVLQLRRVVEENRLAAARVQFDSRGGDLLAAVEIGYYLREKGFVTEVGAFNGGWGKFAPGECHSACALAYVGGKYRYMDAGSRLAVHRFATDRSGDAVSSRDVEQETQALAGLLVGYLQQMGVDLAFFNRMSERPHEDLGYLAMDDLLRMNVVNNGRMAPVWDLQIRDGQVVTVGEQERIDNTGTVTLRCGDPLEIHFATAGYDEAWKETVGTGDMQWVLGEERFDVGPDNLAGSISTAGGQFRVAVRLNQGQAARLPSARSIGLATRYGGNLYEFRVDTGTGVNRAAIGRFVGYCGGSGHVGPGAAGPG